MSKKNELEELILEARSKIEFDPNQSKVCADYLNQIIDIECITSKLEDSIKHGVNCEILNPKLLAYNFTFLEEALISVDFEYLGLKILYDRYLLRDHEGKLFESVNTFLMRVAMGIALDYFDKDAKAIEFYQVMANKLYIPSTPTLFHSGTNHSQLSSCYVSVVGDSIDRIFDSYKDNAKLSKYSGGLGKSYTNLRSTGAYIKGTNGHSAGVVPFLKIMNDVAVAVNQSGKRKGACCIYLETWHLDIEEFLELRKNTGDDRRRTHDLHTANWIPDLFMERVINDQEWTLLCPSDSDGLHELYGEAFKEKYELLEAKCGVTIKRFKRIKAVDLWRKMLTMLFETGHPWITFKDPCNLRSPQRHCGIIHSSNLCTEITLNTRDEPVGSEEIAVCNLGSINLVQHLTDGKINRGKLQATIEVAVRMLDDVIDQNYYPSSKAKHSNMLHRPIGLGVMGFHDALFELGIPYSSEEAVKFADQAQELISYFAIEASIDLAKEKGRYETYQGSSWSKGEMPLDTVKYINKGMKADYIHNNGEHIMHWERLRQKAKKQGIRNSNVTAIAPTATIANIVGVSQSIDPIFQNLYVKSNLSGEFTSVNKYLIRDLEALGLWDKALLKKLKKADGSVQNLDVPNNIKELYKTAFEIEPIKLIECASRRQKWLDQSQSLNLYIAEPSGKKLDNIYKMAWLYGLKTTYYLRAKSITTVEQSSVEDVDAVACSIENPDDCEACQ